jgi:hypothetical protein
MTPKDGVRETLDAYVTGNPPPWRLSQARVFEGSAVRRLTMRRGPTDESAQAAGC